MSPKAKRVLIPAGMVAVVMFFSFFAHGVWLGATAFPGGYIENGHYLVAEHGKVLELTAAQYWFSYYHGVALVASYAVVFVLVLRFYCTGDLKDVPR